MGYGGYGTGGGIDLRAAFSSLPKWLWPFVAACLAIPLVSVSGPLPALIGIGSAIACAQLARNKARSVTLRVLFCLASTTLAWAVWARFCRVTSLISLL